MAKQNDDKAKEIYQDLLDDISASYVDNDFAAFATYLNVPHSTQTFKKSYEINTIDDLRALFDGMCKRFEGFGVTNYIRVCVAAEFKSDTEIVGTHVTYVTRGGENLQEPYPVLSHLLFDGSLWRVRQSENAVDDHNLVGMVLRHDVRHQSAVKPDAGKPYGEEE